MMNCEDLLGNPNECYYCGRKEECTKDHVYPKKKRGKLLVWACHVCQRDKGSKLPHIWVRQTWEKKRYSDIEMGLIKVNVEKLLHKYSTHLL